MLGPSALLSPSASIGRRPDGGSCRFWLPILFLYALLVRFLMRRKIVSIDCSSSMGSVVRADWCFILIQVKFGGCKSNRLLNSRANRRSAVTSRFAGCLVSSTRVAAGQRSCELLISNKGPS